MKKIISVILLSFITFMPYARTKIDLTVEDRSVTATLEDNEATRALTDLLTEGPVTINMSDYGGFEKVGALPQSFPTSDTRITTEPGDIMLYQGNNMVIFYGTNSWSYTRLGKIDGATATSVRDFLGMGDIELTISLSKATAVDATTTETTGMETVFDLSGKPVKARPLPAGVYLINGRKTLISKRH